MQGAPTHRKCPKCKVVTHKDEMVYAAHHYIVGRKIHYKVCMKCYEQEQAHGDKA